MITKTITLPDGKRKYVRAKTEAEAKAKIEKIRQDISRGVDVTKNPTFLDFYTEWFDLYKRPSLRDGTIKNFTDTFRLHVLPYLGHLHIKDIKPMHIQSVLTHADTLCHQSQMTLLNRIGEVFSAAIDNDLIVKTPVSATLKPSGAKKKIQKALTRVQTETLLQVLTGTPAYLFVHLMLLTGLRRSEALGLRIKDVDFDNHMIHVRQQMSNAGPTKLLKTESAYRDIPLPESLERELMLRRFREYVISKPDGTPYKPNSINSLWDYVTRNTDIPCHPHTMRYTYATRLFEAGVDVKQVQYLLGHAKVEETLAIYVKYQEEERQEETADQVRKAFA